VTDPIKQPITEKFKRVFGAHAELTTIAPLAGDASSRRYYRASLSGHGAPQSLIVMELPTGSVLPLSSEELAIFKESPKELPFLNVHRFLDRIGVNVPNIYGPWENDGLLLLEDLGDTSLWDQVQGLTETETIAWYQKAIDQLITLHVRGTQSRDDSCIAFQQRFDEKLYLWEFEHFIEWGLEKRPGAKVAAATIETLRQTFAEIAKLLDRQTACLNHRDYHSWHLMIHGATIRVIDFQDALLAPAQYDLASLLNDRITDSVVTPSIETRLVRYYVEQKNALDTKTIDLDAFTEIYRISAIQRDLKVVGRFYYLDLVKGKPGYMKFIPPTVRRLKRNLAGTARTKNILPLLEEHFEAML